METKQEVKDETEVLSNNDSKDKLDNFIDKLMINLRQEFDNEILSKISNIISLTKNEMNNGSINKIISKNENNKLTNEVMLENLNKLIPFRDNLDNISVNSVDEFGKLLNDYVDNSSFDFKILELSKNEMTNTLVWLLIKEKCDNRNEIFIRLLSIYNKNDDFDINRQPNVGFWRAHRLTLLHWCVRKNNLVILNYLLSNFKDRIDFNIKSAIGKTVYKECIENGKYNMASLILESSLGINLSKSIGDYCTLNDEINSISKLVLFYLNKNCNKNELELIMNKLEETLINLIENKKCLSKYLIKIVFDYNIIKNSNNLNINNYTSNSLELDIKNNKLWNILYNKLKLVLNIDTLYKENIDWFWFKNYILNTNIWLYKIDKNNTLLYNELETIVKTELHKQKNKLESNMKNLINKNEIIWTKICEFEYNNNKYKSYRQDIISNGIQSLYDKQLLNDINISNNSKNSQIFSINDYNNYLSNLIILGHKLNKYFIISIKNIFKDFLNDKKCNFTCGPVKTLERCITKAQLDYNNCKYPTSAHIIDVIRGSLIFNNLEYYYNAITLFIKAINNKNNSSHYISDVLRIKNGFYKPYKKYLENENNEEKSNNENENENYFMPKKYFDVKINLIINYNNQSIVGELQLLLHPMLKNKSKNHELYEITRLKDIITHSNNRTKDNNSNKLLQIAITGKNRSSIAKIITYNNENDININEIGNDNNKTPLFLTSIKRNSLHDVIFKYFSNSIDFNLCDDGDNNILHYVSNDIKEDNSVNRRATSRIVKSLIPKYISVFNHRSHHTTFTPLMSCLQNRNEFVFSFLMTLLSEYPNQSIIDFSIVDKHNNNTFHHLFWCCNFNNININLIMNRYKIYNKINNINNNNLLFSKGENNNTIFDYGFGYNKTFSLKLLNILELHLNNNNKLYKFIFEYQNSDGTSKDTPFMYLIRRNGDKILLIEYLVKKFKNKIIENNYKPINEIRNLYDKTVMDYVKELDSNNPDLLLFKTEFPKLF